MSSILVPIDGSESSLRALQYAISLVQQTDDQIVILNVQPSFRTPNVQKYFSQQDIRNYQEELSREALTDAVKLLESLKVPYESMLQIGQTAQEVSNTATELDASAIVMGSRGAGAIKGKLLGSVSYGVLHEANCPVTIVR